MAYFPNGTSFADWQDQTCKGCLNERDNGSGTAGCAIKDALFLHGYEHNECAISDYLIPEDGPDAWKCRMKLTAFDLARDPSIDRRHADRARYNLALGEMRHAEPDAIAPIEARQGRDAQRLDAKHESGISSKPLRASS